MKAILLCRPGSPSALEYVDVPTPRPCEGEVLVQADTIGVSMPEVLVRKGVYAWMPPLPAIPGIELAGTIVEQGAGHRPARLHQRARFAGACGMLCRIYCRACACHAPVATRLFTRAGSLPV